MKYDDQGYSLVKIMQLILLVQSMKQITQFMIQILTTIIGH